MSQNLDIATAMMPRITATNAASPMTPPELVLDQEDAITTIYAPFDYIETRAKLDHRQSAEVLPETGLSQSDRPACPERRHRVSRL